ncbi:MAG TPA: DUF1566 domain-containing protein [Candidatus Competibacteraceae bacterium]|nr:DUF1566 domain-containing protein [Candidatus Competibacteraceae bacterium]HRZ07845.1 DUF1566 domain-containing protein [Candidatus Competibacteraceae bacterium]HSA47655.1 DUF1566 domain-containing protein [Candidatus Competibacteraceae bacterium]
MRHLNHWPIWRDAHLLMLEIEQAVRGFARYHPYTIGSELRATALRLCQAIHRAYSRQQSRRRLGQLISAWVDGHKMQIQWARALTESLLPHHGEIRMNHQPHFWLSRAPWWVGLALAAALPARAEVTCVNQNLAVPATTPTMDFTLHDDGTVTHTPTGLMWMRCSLGQTWTGTTCTGTGNTYTWSNALNAAQTVNASSGYAGHADWRLPNKNELASIVEERCWLPAINAAIFPGTPSDGWYWSSSPGATGGSGYAWYVDFYSGLVNILSQSNGNRVRLVRAGQQLGDLQLPPPSNVQASDGTVREKVVITWDSVSGVTSYEVWRGANSASDNAVQIAAGVTGTSYDDALAPYGKTSYYWIKACSSVGCSDFGDYDTGYNKALVPQ